ncbi:MAG: hypothetical protein O9297_03740 [Flavobacterium sp.]|uniref:hypothetical protein n=1 Tax=Flavobacterium sp. TaxID=239 RepID=UPI0022BB090B|nr:hypothetical protein [Flavobacterium sp.]MCZ8296314.1 hypothetical protein [Flavobacterium sp.]
MKKIVLLFLSFFVVSLSSCDTNDDDFYNTEYVRVNGLVTIETQANYAVGDKITVNCVVDRLVNELGQSTPLDIRKTTNNAPSLTFSYVLEKQNGSEWVPVSVPANQMEVSSGQLQNLGFYLATAPYDTVQDAYVFRAGLPLLSSGTYRLSYGYNSEETDVVELRSNSASDAITLLIYTTSNALNNSGFYTFTVN